MLKWSTPNIRCFLSLQQTAHTNFECYLYTGKKKPLETKRILHLTLYLLKTERYLFVCTFTVFVYRLFRLVGRYLFSMTVFRIIIILNRFWEFYAVKITPPWFIHYAKRKKTTNFKLVLMWNAWKWWTMPNRINMIDVHYGNISSKEKKILSWTCNKLNMILFQIKRPIESLHFNFSFIFNDFFHCGVYLFCFVIMIDAVKPLSLTYNTSKCVHNLWSFRNMKIIISL